MPNQTRIVAPGPNDDTVRTPDGQILPAPAGWELLPPGDAGLTRRVKAAGPTWTVQQKKGRKTFSQGVWAPAERIATIRAELEAERSTDAYAARRAADTARRNQKHADYVDFRGAVLAFLDFALAGRPPANSAIFAPNLTIFENYVDSNHHFAFYMRRDSMMTFNNISMLVFSAVVLTAAASCSRADLPSKSAGDGTPSASVGEPQKASDQVAAAPAAAPQANVDGASPPAGNEVAAPRDNAESSATEAPPADATESLLAFAPGAEKAGDATAVPATPADAPELVPVGDAGNKADSTGYGAVEYEYKIGKYEVTNDEYCAFLNAVAKRDTRGLYDPRMAGGPEGWGGIVRRGTYGDYTYTVRDEMGNRPVNYVTFESCARYANWLTNGGGDGDTEDGSYRFARGIVTVPDHAALAKEKSPHWVVPSENEWYKAAYYDPNKAGGGYWKYPAKSDSAPKANINTNWATEAGEQGVASAYGTFDQGGNVWEYNDTRNGGKVGLRGGSFFLNDSNSHMQSNIRYDVYSAKWPNYGFRVVRLGGAKAAE